MTTLIGIKAGKGKKGVILGSDMSRTETRWTPQGDVAYRNQRRIEGQKIYVDNKREVALCMSGIYDQSYVDFLAGVLEGDIDIKKVTETGNFEELLRLNLSRWYGQIPNNEISNSLLLATRFEEPKLYTCWPLGKVEERKWTSIGSGSDYALQYISEQPKVTSRWISLDDGIDLAVAGLDKASQDLYTGGLDLIAIVEEGIIDLGEKIRADIDDARSKSIEIAKEKFKI